MRFNKLILYRELAATCSCKHESVSQSVSQSVHSGAYTKSEEITIGTMTQRYTYLPTYLSHACATKRVHLIISQPINFQCQKPHLHPQVFGLATDGDAWMGFHLGLSNCRSCCMIPRGSYIVHERMDCKHVEDAAVTVFFY